MFFPGKGCFIIQKTKKILGKVTDKFPARYQKQSHREGIFQFISEKRGSLTLETALVLPLFLFAVLAVLQFALIQNASSALLSGAQDTAKEMAAYAYIQKFGTEEHGGAASELLQGGLSAAYARLQIQKKSGIGKETGTFTLLQSDFSGEIIDLTGSFWPTHTYTIFPVKKVRSIFRTRVRAWTGRTGNTEESGETDGEDQEEEQQVYVAETGSVYHTDPECSHIRLGVRSVPRNQLSGMRNVSGGRYHTCERCGAGTGGTVYISPYGDRYHSSLSCGGLRRTVSTMPLSEAGNLRPCSRCGKK